MTGMNWFWLVIGIVVGVAGQRWWEHSRRRRDRQAEPSLGSPPLSEPVLAETIAEPSYASSLDGVAVSKADNADWLWLSYVRALERAQFQGGFLARAAHELRSPLSSLMGLQQLILADLCDDAEEERHCVAQSYEAAQNLHSLMDQLIGISKLEQGSQRLDIQPVALDVLLEDVESFVQLQVADRNCRLSLQLPAQPVYAMADYNSLRQALVMLIETALSQKVSELQLALNLGQSGITLRFEADRALIPVEELKTELQTDDVKRLNQARLDQLKQSLIQAPESRFVPHRLSPGMVLLVSQLLVDLNGGKLELASPSKPADPAALEGAAVPGAIATERENSLEEGSVLELWLPCSQEANRQELS